MVGGIDSGMTVNDFIDTFSQLSPKPKQLLTVRSFIDSYKVSS